MKKENKHGLYIGQKVYIRDLRGSSSNVLIEAKVISVGRVYFTVMAGWRKERFNIETLAHDNGQYSPAYSVYFSEQEYRDEVECYEIARNLNEKFGYLNNLRSLGIDNLIKIMEIIEGQPSFCECGCQKRPDSKYCTTCNKLHSI